MNDSDIVNDFFGVVVEDWTPAAARRTARVLFAPVSFDQRVLRSCSVILSAAEVLRADNFLSENDRNHFIQRRAFRRFCAALALGSPGTSLPQIGFEETEEGRPYLSNAPGLWFSFASCRFGFLGAWSSTHRIGVDIEDQTQILETSELAQQFFSEAEARMIDECSDGERSQTFFQLWSLKESALKSIGEGLPFGLDAFGFDLSPSPRVSRAPLEYGGPDLFDPHVIEGNRTCAALVTYLK
jgi:4'-phosphopantetheinyl transferase